MQGNVAKVIYSYLILCFTYSTQYGQVRYGSFQTTDYVLMPMGWLFSAVVFYFFIKLIFKIATSEIWLERFDYILLSVRYHKQ